MEEKQTIIYGEPVKEYMDVETGESIVGAIKTEEELLKLQEAQERKDKRDKYLRAFDAEIFKEYSLEEYIIQNRKSPSDFLDWGEFENWCKTRGAIRND